MKICLFRNWSMWMHLVILSTLYAIIYKDIILFLVFSFYKFKTCLVRWELRVWVLLSKVLLKPSNLETTKQFVTTLNTRNMFMPRRLYTSCFFFFFLFAILKHIYPVTTIYTHILHIYTHTCVIWFEYFLNWTRHK